MDALRSTGNTDTSEYRELQNQLELIENQAVSATSRFDKDLPDGQDCLGPG